MLKTAWFLFFFVFCCSLCKAGHYANPSEHFSMTVPDGWTKFSETELGKIAPFVSGAATARCEAGYWATPLRPHHGNCFLIFYTACHVDDSWDSFSTRFRAAITKNATDTNADGASTQPSKEPVIQVDRNRNEILAETYRQTSHGDFICRTIDCLGRDGMVILVSPAIPADQSSTQSADAESSFKFDHGYSFNDKPIPAVKNFDTPTLFGIGVGAIAGVALLNWKKRKNDDGLLRPR